MDKSELVIKSLEVIWFFAVVIGIVYTGFFL
jgi:hypothetical protein